MNKNEFSKNIQDQPLFTLVVEHDFTSILTLTSIIFAVPVSFVWLKAENILCFTDLFSLTDEEKNNLINFCSTTDLHLADNEPGDVVLAEIFPGQACQIEGVTYNFYTAYPLKDLDGAMIGALFLLGNQSKIITADQHTAITFIKKDIIRYYSEKREVQELKQYQNLLQLSDSLVFIGDAAGHFKKVNSKFEKILGWDKDHFMNTLAGDFIHPDDVESTGQELTHLGEGQVTLNFKQRFKTRDGDYKLLQWTSYQDALTGYIFGVGRDITEETLKIQQLAVSEQQLSAFFANSQGLLCTHDLDGKLLLVNKAAAAILGYTTEEINQLSLFDITPENTHTGVHNYLSEIRLKGNFSGQLLTKHKNGSLHVWIFKNILQQDINGDDYVIGNALDITERHQLEKDLTRTKEMLEQTNKVARVGGWEFDVIKQKIYWSPVTKEIHGVPADFEPDLKSGINFYKEGVSRETILKVIKEAVDEGKSWDLELQIVNLQQEELWVRSLGNAECEDGRCIRIYGAFQDINAYKLTEKALQVAIEKEEELNEELHAQIELVIEQDQTIEKIKEFKFLGDSIPEIIYTAEPDGGITYYNQYWYDFTGLSLEETAGWKWESILHPDDLENCRNTWKESVETGNLHEVEYRLKRASDGVYIWYRGRAMPMRDESGKIIKWFGFCTNIDVYKKALNLESKVSQYEDFNRIVAHNLRGPAGSIQMMLEMMEETDNREEERKELLVMLKKSSISLNETLDELMKVLEIRNNIDLPSEKCDLKELMQVVESMLKGQILAKHATILTDFNAPSISFPRIYLVSIFYNLISNSLKYSKRDVAPEIIISSRLANDRTILIFKDNGIGIDLKRNGDNMFKLNKVFHRGYDSKGVGLFMTKIQIETFGGRIAVESEPNVGTIFTIEL